MDAFYRADTDPADTSAWIESLDAVLHSEGPQRARYLLGRSDRARHRQRRQRCRSPPTRPTSTPFRPTSSRSTRAIARSSGASRASSAGTPWRWSCAPTSLYDGIGGHISTYASCATLFEVGFNHFFRGPPGRRRRRPRLLPGPRLARRLRARLPRRALSATRSCTTSAASSRGGGLSSYPHPWLMPDFWEFPTVSMGLSPDLLDLPGALQPLPARSRPARHRCAATSGRSSATARPTSPRRWAPSRSRRASTSTT